MYDILELSKKLLPELKDIAKELKIKKAESLKKQDLIYKILDQQAIEATDIPITPISVKDQEESLPEINNQESESSMRRGKRPRTLIPVIKRSVESVMRVSPDDLIKTEAKTADWHEMTIKKEKANEKPDQLKNAEPQLHERKAPKWRTDQKHEEKNDRRERFDKEPFERFEKRKPESVSDNIPENSIPVNNGEASFDEVKPSSDVYFGDIIVEAPVKETIQDTHPVKEEKKERAYDFEGIIYNTVFWKLCQTDMDF
jgi:transcription termination factor Rho